MQPHSLTGGNLHHSLRNCQESFFQHLTNFRAWSVIAIQSASCPVREVGGLRFVLQAIFRPEDSSHEDGPRERLLSPLPL